MNRTFSVRYFAAALVALMLAHAPWGAFAQSGAKGSASPPNRQSPPPGSGTASGAKDLRVGLKGYCPVCIVELKKWVKGAPQLSVVQDGARYYFPGEEQKKAFLEAPAKYTPTLGDDDIVVYAQSKKRVRGSLTQAVLHDGRLYLFANAETKQQFRSNPKAYANADVALGGECPVCRVDMGQRVAGKPEFYATHDGLRYLFPAEAQREKFLTNPAAYVEAAMRAATGAGAQPATSTQPAKSAGSGTR